MRERACLTVLILLLAMGRQLLGGEYLFPESDQRVSISAPGTRSSGTAALCNDDSGRVYVFWSDSWASGYEIAFNRSLDGGQSWENPTFAVEGIGGVRLQARCDSRGSVYVLSERRLEAPHPAALYVNRSRDFGDTWSLEAVQVNHSPWWSHSGPTSAQMLNDDSGHLFVIWREARYTSSDNGIYFNVSDDFGETWGSTDVRLDSVADGRSSGSPRLCHDEMGNVFAVWPDFDFYGNRWLWFRHSNDHGKTWREPVLLAQGPDTFDDYDLECDESGGVYLALASRGGSVSASRSIDHGATWTELTNIEVHEGTAHAPNVEVDAMGRVFVAYVAATSEIRVAISRNRGRTFGASVVATDPDARLSSVNVGLAVTDSGYAVLQFEDLRLPTSTIFATYSTDYGETWSADQPLDVGTSLAQWSSMSHDSFGNFYVVWTDWRDHGSNGDVYFNRGFPRLNVRLDSVEGGPIVSPQSGGSA